MDDIKEDEDISLFVKYKLFKKYLDFHKFSFFFFYKSNKILLGDNNKFIFIFMVNYLKDKEITNNNYFSLRNTIYELLINKVTYEKKYEALFFYNIIDNIFHSFYMKHFNELTNQMKNHLPFNTNNESFKQNIINGISIPKKRN